MELKLITKNKTDINWKEYCKNCKRNHIVTNKPCTSCGVHYTPQPVSETVLINCNQDYYCDGCQAYRDHY